MVDSVVGFIVAEIDSSYYRREGTKTFSAFAALINCTWDLETKKKKKF